MNLYVAFVIVWVFWGDMVMVVRTDVCFYALGTSSLMEWIVSGTLPGLLVKVGVQCLFLGRTQHRRLA